MDPSIIGTIIGIVLGFACGVIWTDECHRVKKRNEAIELEQEVERLRTALSEAEYAMVGGNDIMEDIPWETADLWFRYMEQALKGD